MNWLEHWASPQGLAVGGCAMKKLKEEFGTPLYVYDADGLKDRAIAYQSGLAHPALETSVIYASKAACFKQLLALFNDIGMGLDVVSEGELYTAKAAGFDMEKVVFHGNNKLERELEMALAYGVGTVILDHWEEAKQLSDLAVRADIRQEVLLRVNPGVEAHTHVYIKTATSDSKFGIAMDESATVLKEIASLPGLVLRGIHCHIGSQIFAADSFLKAADVMLDHWQRLKAAGLALDTLNLGGGFGVYYHQGDEPFEVPTFLQKLAAHIAERSRKDELGVERLWIEPGRSLVNDFGVTLYEVGDSKVLADDVQYVFVDGGMGDNLRPALYEAKYEAALAERPYDAPSGRWRVAGKYCESGDVLIRDLSLPTPQKGETLAVFGTGAYTFSMFSNYNRLLRPAVIMVKDGQAQLAVQRQSLDDLIALDV